MLPGLHCLRISPNQNSPVSTGATVVEVEDGNVYTYEGEHGEEALRKVIFFDPDDGKVVINFAGEKDNEHFYRKEYEDGLVMTYEGAKDNEALRKMTTDAVTIFYGGPKNHEYMIRKEFKSGTIEAYDGAKDEEALREVSIVTRFGRRSTFYGGPKGQEYPIRMPYSADRNAPF